MTSFTKGLAMSATALAAALVAGTAAAQTSVTATPTAVPHGTLRGIAVDSVRGGFLRGASVAVVGPSRMTLTDSLGRFAIDSIPPGEYTIALFDEMLDSLAITVMSAPTRFSAGDTVTLLLAIPSQATIVAAKCGPAATSDAPVALFGTVLAADEGSPAADAEVRVEWLEVTIDQATGVRTLPQKRVATTDAAGRYKVCGLPEGINAEVSALRGADSTSAVPLIYGESRLGIANLFIAGSHPGVASRTVGAPVRGRVVDADGKPIADATVMLSSSPEAASSDQSGRFEISGTRLGTQSVVVRKLGFQPVEVVVDVMPQPAAPVTVRLDQFVPIIESVVIQARHSAALERVGFARRRRYGLGRYYEAKDLEHVTSLERFFQTIRVLNRQTGLPMAQGARLGNQDVIDVRDTPSPGGTSRSNARRRPPNASEGATGGESGSCRATYVDGVRVEDTEFIMPNEVAAIEIYSPTMTPQEFKTSYATCATVVIWTDWKLRRNNRN
jgi:hypothetical protein